MAAFVAEYPGQRYIGITDNREDVLRNILVIDANI